MNKYITFLLLALAVSPIFTSCLSDEEVETSDYCYISGFSLGSMKRTMFTVSQDGEDSVYSTTFVGSLFPMTIDQRALTIQNNDSLPLRTVVSRVLTTATYEGSLVWRKAEPVGDDTLWTAYSTADSLDFTDPLHFACVASNGLSMRIYTVSLNVHKQKADTTVWNNMGEAQALDLMEERKAVCMNGQLIVLGTASDGSLICAQRPTASDGEWAAFSTTGAEGADISSLQQSEGTLFLTTEGGAVLQSTNATDWVEASFPQREGIKLVAASASRLYARLDGSLVSSDGNAWEEESLDDDSDNLPDNVAASFCYQLPDGQNRLMLIGTNGGDDPYCATWAKTWTADETAASWTYYTPNGADKRRCPAFDNINIDAYDDGFIAFGGASPDGRFEPMDSVLYSQDHGITWKPYDDDDMDTDPLMREDAQEARHIASAVDDDKFLWVMIDSKVWRGRINRLGFLRQDPD